MADIFLEQSVHLEKQSRPLDSNPRLSFDSGSIQTVDDTEKLMPWPIGSVDYDIAPSSRGGRLCYIGIYKGQFA